MACICGSTKESKGEREQQTPDSPMTKDKNVTKATFRVVGGKLGVKLDPNVAGGAIIRELADSPGQPQVRAMDIVVSIGGERLDGKKGEAKLKIAERKIKETRDGQLEIEIIRGAAPVEVQQKRVEEVATRKDAPVNAGTSDDKREAVPEGKWAHVMVDGKGKIAMNPTVAAARADALKKVFAITDVDGSGGISLDELQSIGTWKMQGQARKSHKSSTSKSSRHWT